MAMLWLSSPTQRRMKNELIAQIKKEILAWSAARDQMSGFFDSMEQNRGWQLSNEKRKEVLQMVTEKNYDIELDNSYHLDSVLNDIPIFAKWFFIKKWRFYLAPGKYNFFTSDTPIIEVWPDLNKAETHIVERIHYFSLTPKILVELSNPYSPGKKIKRQTLQNESEIIKCNLFHFYYPNSYVYSKDKVGLQYILDNYRPPKN